MPDLIANVVCGDFLLTTKWIGIVITILSILGIVNWLDIKIDNIINSTFKIFDRSINNIKMNVKDIAFGALMIAIFYLFFWYVEFGMLIFGNFLARFDLLRETKFLEMMVVFPSMIFAGAGLYIGFKILLAVLSLLWFVLVSLFYGLVSLANHPAGILGIVGALLGIFSWVLIDYGCPVSL